MYSTRMEKRSLNVLRVHQQLTFLKRPADICFLLLKRGIVHELSQNLVNNIINELRCNIPQALPTIGLLKNAVEGRVLCRLHTDSWPSFNSLVCQIIYPRASDVADLLCYCRGSGDDLLQLLVSHKLISWGKKQQIYHIESELSDYLCEHLVDPYTGRRVWNNSLEAVTAYLPNGFEIEMSCPDGYVIGSLYPKHTPLVLKHWTKYRDWPKGNSFIGGLISNFFTKAVYSIDDLDSPVAWILEYPFGRQGGLYTLESFRYSSFGTLLTFELAKAIIAQSGRMAEALTEVGNTVSRRITTKLGFVETEHTVKWTVYEPIFTC